MALSVTQKVLNHKIVYTRGRTLPGQSLQSFDQTDSSRYLTVIPNVHKNTSNIAPLKLILMKQIDTFAPMITE